MGAMLHLAAAWLLSPLLLALAPLLAIFLVASLLAGVVGLSIDIFVITADQLRRHRGRIEAAALKVQWGLGRLCRHYALWLLQLFWSTERLLCSLGNALAPMLAEILQRLPLLAWALAPVVTLASMGSRIAEDAYAFVHDEIVPVSLDLAERLPFLEEVLLRYAYSNGNDTDAW